MRTRPATAATPAAASASAANSPRVVAPGVSATGAIAAGDEAAFTAFYTAWFAPTLVLAKAITRRDEAFCLDVVQDVMLAVAERLPPLRDERAVRAWLRTATLRASADRQRSELRRRRREGQVGGERGAVSVEEPSAPLSAAEQAAWLAVRLQELPEVDRALLLARFGDETSVADAGAAFGLGDDAAHGRVRRVLVRLRRWAAEWWHG